MTMMEEVQAGRVECIVIKNIYIKLRIKNIFGFCLAMNEAKRRQAGLILLSVYVNVFSGTREHKFQPVTVNLVYPYPIIGDMTATITSPFPIERVVAMPWFKRGLFYNIRSTVSSFVMS